MILLTASEAMERLFDLDMQLVADATGMIIAIFVLYLAMSYFLFEPAKKVLKNRQDKIKNELDEAVINDIRNVKDVHSVNWLLEMGDHVG